MAATLTVDIPDGANVSLVNGENGFSVTVEIAEEEAAEAPAVAPASSPGA